MSFSFIASAIRHAITVGAGSLATFGIAIPETSVERLTSSTTEVAMAVVLYAVSLAWSTLEKRTGINFKKVLGG